MDGGWWIVEGGGGRGDVHSVSVEGGWWIVEDGWWMTETLVHDCSASLLPSASKVTRPPKPKCNGRK